MVVQDKCKGKESLAADEEDCIETFLNNIQLNITWKKLNDITDLDLSNCRLTTLPNALLKCISIKKLNLSKNDIEDIPHCFYLGLNKIEELDLSNNKIAKFEIQPNCCKTLRVLSLCCNNLTNIPPWILDLQATNLEELKYDLNKITTLRCIFDISMYFPVCRLSLRNCILRQEDLKFIKECKNLEDLDLSNSESTKRYTNILEDIDYLFIQPTWQNMKVLKLNYIAISIFPTGITWLESLTHLYLRGNDFQWLPVDGLEYLVNLEILDLSFNSISTIPEKLTWLENINSLNFSHNKIEIIPDFSKMKSLRTLDLYYNKLDNFNCDKSGTNLKYLDLEYNYFNTDGCDIVNYKNMKCEYRENYCMNELRFDGYKIESRSEDEDSDKESNRERDSHFYGDGVSPLSDRISECTEDWDEEIRMNGRNDHISPSDDEWEGFERVKNIQKNSPGVNPKAASSFTYNEAVIFCDAD